MTEIIKCNKCGHVLFSGTGMIGVFGPGVAIGCGKCGNEYVFGKENPNNTPAAIDKDAPKGITFVV